MRAAADRRSAPRAVWELVRGLAALAILAALLVGVPVLALPRLGRPLPDGVPSASGLVDALLHQGVDLPVVLRAAAAVLWGAWAVFAACVLVEALAWARRREARPVRGLGGVQRLAANLVATAVLVLPSLPHLARVPASAAELAVARGPAMTVMYQAAPAPAAPGAASSQPLNDSLTPAVGAPKAYVVQRYDCLWHIAEEHLGDPLRWKEIEALTAGLVQPDGRRLGDPNLILPGWTVLLPADAVGLDPAAAPPSASSSPAPGASTSATTVAAAGAGQAGAAPTTAALAPPTTATTATPATTAPAVSPPPAVASAAAVTPTTAGSASSAAAAQPPNRVKSTTPNVSPARALVGVSSLIGGVFVWRMRREGMAAHRRRRRGRELVHADPATEPVERRVRAIAAVETVHWVDATLRYASAALAEAGGGGVEGILCVRPGQLGMELVVDPPASPVGRFHSADDGRTWTLDPDMDLAELQELAWGQVLAPALCSVGSTPDGPVLVDLEQAGVLAVEGDPARVEGFLAGAALELATAPWANDTAVYLLGGDERLAMRELVDVVTDGPAFASNIDRLTSLVDDEDLGDAASTLAARVAPGNAEGWFPTVVVAHPGADADVLAQLSSRAQPRRAGLTLVGPGPLPGATWRLILGPDGAAVLEPLGLELDSRIDADVVAALAGRVAARTERVDIAPVVELVPDAAPSPVAVPAPLVDEEPLEGEVRVLGPVEVDWATSADDVAATPERASLLAAAVAYLGTHDDHPVPGSRLQEALWPLGNDDSDVRSGAVKEGTLRSTMSRVRKALGKDSLGRKHLPAARHGGYALGPRYRSDWRRFRDLVAASHTAPSAESIELLRQALSLVRGRPFEDAPPAYFGWAEDSPLASDIEVAVARAAEELGARALEAGMPELAEWAARQGLLMVPVREDLHRVRLQAAFDAGDPDGIEAAYTEATRAIRVHIDPAEPLQDETERLYQRLKRACRTHGPQRSEEARRARATTG